MARYKTISFALVHMTVAFSIVYLMTGSLALGGAVALLEPAANTVAYFFHEKAWERFSRKTAGAHADENLQSGQALA
jgi:uncharacterized membrane protein